MVLFILFIFFYLSYHKCGSRVWDGGLLISHSNFVMLSLKTLRSLIYPACAWIHSTCAQAVHLHSDILLRRQISCAPASVLLLVLTLLLWITCNICSQIFFCNKSKVPDQWNAGVLLTDVIVRCDWVMSSTASLRLHQLTVSGFEGKTAHSWSSTKARSRGGTISFVNPTAGILFIGEHTKHSSAKTKFQEHWEKSESGGFQGVFGSKHQDVSEGISKSDGEVLSHTERPLSLIKRREKPKVKSQWQRWSEVDISRYGMKMFLLCCFGYLTFFLNTGIDLCVVINKSCI